MFHKQMISFAVLLSYAFVLGRPNERQTVTDILCSNLSYTFDYFELDDTQSYTYTLKFESDNRCEEAYQMLEYNYDLPCVKDNCIAGGEIQTMMSRDTLEQVCEDIKPNNVRYEEQLVDLCERNCHNLECVKNFDNTCDNITTVDEIFKLENIDELQIYAVLFNGTKKQEQCSRTAKRLNRLPQQLIDQGINGIVHTENCMGTEPFIAATLNLNGLEWVCNKSQVIRVAFEETYFNENVCQDATRAKQLFFPDDDNKPKQFRVSYLTSDASAACKDGRNILNGIRQGSGQGSGQEDICAVVNGEDCEATLANFDVLLNYEALEYVCDSTDFNKGTIGTMRVSKVEESNTNQAIVCNTNTYIHV